MNRKHSTHEMGINSQAGQDSNNNASFSYKAGNTSASQNVTDTETVVNPCEEVMFFANQMVHMTISVI